jgi:pimeloyl-ACP methyl ester carboxylesterase
VAIASDPGMNAMDRMNRRTLLDAGFVEESVDSPVGRQTCFSIGTGQPLWLLHGAGDNAGAWSKTATPLAASGRYRILIPDLAGHGTSEPGEGRLSMEIFLAGLTAVAERAADGPAILTGNSFGAWLAMVWARENPDRVERLVAVNGGPVTGLRPDLTLMPPDRVEARRLWQALVDQSHWAVPDFVLDEVIRKGRDGAIPRMSIPEMQPYLMDGHLAEFAAPVDLIWGESDQVVPLAYARQLQAGLAAARLTTIPGCGHVPQLECPERFNAALLGVLRQPPPARQPT